MEPKNIKGFHGLSHANSVANLLTLSPTNKSFSSQPVESVDQTLSQANLSEKLESSSTYFTRFISDSISNMMHVPLHMFSPNTSSLSADSTFPEQRDHQLGIANENRLRRLISNRESARRSRMRRKKQIEELQVQVNQLQSMNHQLSEKVIQLLENNHQILQENSQLRGRLNSLQVVLSDFLAPQMRNVEENICKERLQKILPTLEVFASV